MIKYLYIFVVLLPLATTAQDSARLECKLAKDTDPYTRETRLSSGFISLQGASLTIDADKKEIDFFFAIPDRCFSDASTVFIYFEGSKTKTTYRNTGSMNCEGYFHFIFRNGTTPPTVLKKLASQKVANFVFTDNDKKTVIISLLPDQQKKVMDAAACIVQESQSLL